MDALHEVLSRLFPAALNLAVDQFKVEADLVSLHLSSCAVQQPCPHCHALSGSIHSHYDRRFQHLPRGGLGVSVHLHVRRFRCHGCQPARTFAERFPELVAPYARYSAAVCGLFKQIVVLIGGEGGQQLLASLPLRVSGDRLLAEQQRSPLPPA